MAGMPPPPHTEIRRLVWDELWTLLHTGMYDNQTWWYYVTEQPGQTRHRHDFPRMCETRRYGIIEWASKQFDAERRCMTFGVRCAVRVGPAQIAAVPRPNDNLRAAPY